MGKWNENPVPLKTNIAEEMDYVKGWYVRYYESLCNQFGTPPVTTGIANIREPVTPDNIYSLYTSLLLANAMIFLCSLNTSSPFFMVM